jgi:hypothetical protein
VACGVGAGIAFATIPDGSGVIHGCYTKSTGTIRVIDSAATKLQIRRDSSQLEHHWSHRPCGSCRTRWAGRTARTSR